jgi:hypothetical protein
LKTVIKISLVILVQLALFQQNIIAQDTSLVVRTPVKKITKDPLRATMLAAVFPGMGQVYNRKYWKIPLVYAGFGGLAYSIGSNSSNYRTYMKAYQDFTDNIPETRSYQQLEGLKGVDPAAYDRVTNPQTYSYYKDQMLRLIDYYKRYRDLSYIGLGAWYLISILDANVDASLFNYDVSDNLDLAIMPVQIPVGDGIMFAGVNVSFRYKF